MKLILGAVLAAIVMFVWGFVFWALPVHGPAFQHLTDEEPIRNAIRDHVPQDGVYVFPDPDLGEEAFLEKHREGPLGLLMIRRDGTEAMSPVVFIKGFVHYFLTAVLIGFLMRMAGPGRSGLAVAALGGIAAAFWSQFNGPIWFYLPWPYHLMTALYGVVSWILAGLVLSRFVRFPR